jgi:DNA-binding SARP family transcriptional activator/tetratricopeptide (TPR) repeat protein/TolB-like protein
MIRFRLLGALDLRGPDGREIGSVLAQPKRTALLACLASSPRRFHRRDTLLGLFWPDSDQSHARDSLRQAVRYLRRSLGEGVVVGRGDEELGVDETLLWCDAAAFEQAVDAGELERALDLYRGDLLTGFFLSDVPEFERWLERERARLRGRALETAWVLAERREAARDQAGAARYARRATELSPDDEGTLRRLMTLLDRLGDRAGAVRVCEEFAARLEEECGIGPSAETMALMQRVRAGDLVETEHRLEAVESPRESPDHRDSARGSEPRPALPESGSGDVPRRSIPSYEPGPRSTGLALATALLVLVIAGASAFVAGTRSDPGDPGRVVVVPFENHTGDPALDPLSRWAADWILQGLTRTDGIQVLDAAVGLPGSSAGEPRGPQLRALLGSTGAGTVVSGAYYRHGDSIQFQVRITDARGGTMIPSVEPISGSLEQPQVAIHALAERVTGVLAAHRHPWIRAVNAEGSRPPSYEAYLAWVDGLEQFGRRDFEGARERLLHAASLDSSFISPLLWAAAAYANVGQHARADSLLRIADGHRSRLLPFDRQLLDMWRANLRGDWTAHYRATRQMLEVAPASERALYLAGGSALAINHPGEALELVSRIDVSRSAVDWDAYGTRLTDAYHLLGDHGRELEEARRVRERRPELLRTHLDELRALAALGRAEEVLQRLDWVMALSPQPQITPADVARIAAEELRAHGSPRAAEQALDRAIAWYRTEPPGERAREARRFGLARVLYQAGRWDEAEALFRELAERSPERVDYLGYLGVVAVRTERMHEAEQISDALARVSVPYMRGANILWRARIAAAAGQQEEAIALFRMSFAQGQRYGIATHTDPDLSSLRKSPDFQRLIQPKR